MDALKAAEVTCTGLALLLVAAGVVFVIVAAVDLISDYRKDRSR